MRSYSASASPTLGVVFNAPERQTSIVAGGNPFVAPPLPPVKPDSLSRSSLSMSRVSDASGFVTVDSDGFDSEFDAPRPVATARGSGSGGGALPIVVGRSMSPPPSLAAPRRTAAGGGRRARAKSSLYKLEKLLGEDQHRVEQEMEFAKDAAATFLDSELALMPCAAPIARKARMKAKFGSRRGAKTKKQQQPKKRGSGGTLSKIRRSVLFRRSSPNSGSGSAARDDDAALPPIRVSAPLTRDDLSYSALYRMSPSSTSSAAPMSSPVTLAPPALTKSQSSRSVSASEHLNLPHGDVSVPPSPSTLARMKSAPNLIPSSTHRSSDSNRGVNFSNETDSWSNSTRTSMSSPRTSTSSRLDTPRWSNSRRDAPRWSSSGDASSFSPTTPMTPRELRRGSSGPLSSRVLRSTLTRSKSSTSPRKVSPASTSATSQRSSRVGCKHTPSKSDGAFAILSAIEIDAPRASHRSVGGHKYSSSSPSTSLSRGSAPASSTAASAPAPKHAVSPPFSRAKSSHLLTPAAAASSSAERRQRRGLSSESVRSKSARNVMISEPLTRSRTGSETTTEVSRTKMRANMRHYQSLPRSFTLNDERTRSGRSSSESPPPPPVFSAGTRKSKSKRGSAGKLRKVLRRGNLASSHGRSRSTHGPGLGGLGIRQKLNTDPNAVRNHTPPRGRAPARHSKGAAAHNNNKKKRQSLRERIAPRQQQPPRRRAVSPPVRTLRAASTPTTGSPKVHMDERPISYPPRSKRNNSATSSPAYSPGVSPHTSPVFVHAQFPPLPAGMMMSASSAERYSTSASFDESLSRDAVGELSGGKMAPSRREERDVAADENMKRHSSKLEKILGAESISARLSSSCPPGADILSDTDEDFVIPPMRRYSIDDDCLLEMPSESEREAAAAAEKNLRRHSSKLERLLGPEPHHAATRMSKSVRVSSSSSSSRPVAASALFERPRDVVDTSGRMPPQSELKAAADQNMQKHSSKLERILGVSSLDKRRDAAPPPGPAPPHHDHRRARQRSRTMLDEGEAGEMPVLSRAELMSYAATSTGKSPSHTRTYSPHSVPVPKLKGGSLSVPMSSSGRQSYQRSRTPDFRGALGRRPKKRRSHVASTSTSPIPTKRQSEPATALSKKKSEADVRRRWSTSASSQSHSSPSLSASRRSSGGPISGIGRGPRRSSDSASRSRRSATSIGFVTRRSSDSASRPRLSSGGGSLKRTSFRRSLTREFSTTSSFSLSDKKGSASSKRSSSGDTDSSRRRSSKDKKDSKRRSSGEKSNSSGGKRRSSGEKNNKTSKLVKPKGSWGKVKAARALLIGSNGGRLSIGQRRKKSKPNIPAFLSRPHPSAAAVAAAAAAVDDGHHAPDCDAESHGTPSSNWHTGRTLHPHNAVKDAPKKARKRLAHRRSSSAPPVNLPDLLAGLRGSGRDLVKLKDQAAATGAGDEHKHPQTGGSGQTGGGALPGAPPAVSSTAAPGRSGTDAAAKDPAAETWLDMLKRTNFDEVQDELRRQRSAKGSSLLGENAGDTSPKKRRRQRSRHHWSHQSVGSVSSLLSTSSSSSSSGSKDDGVAAGARGPTSPTLSAAPMHRHPRQRKVGPRPKGMNLGIDGRPIDIDLAALRTGDVLLVRSSNAVSFSQSLTKWFGSDLTKRGFANSVHCMIVVYAAKNVVQIAHVTTAGGSVNLLHPGDDTESPMEAVVYRLVDTSSKIKEIKELAAHLAHRICSSRKAEYNTSSSIRSVFKDPKFDSYLLNSSKSMLRRKSVWAAAAAAGASGGRLERQHVVGKAAPFSGLTTRRDLFDEEEDSVSSPSSPQRKPQSHSRTQHSSPSRVRFVDQDGEQSDGHENDERRMSVSISQMSTHETSSSSTPSVASSSPYPTPPMTNEPSLSRSMMNTGNLKTPVSSRSRSGSKHSRQSSTNKKLQKLLGSDINLDEVYVPPPEPIQSSPSPAPLSETHQPPGAVQSPKEPSKAKLRALLGGNPTAVRQYGDETQGDDSPMSSTESNGTSSDKASSPSETSRTISVPLPDLRHQKKRPSVSKMRALLGANPEQMLKDFEKRTVPLPQHNRSIRLKQPSESKMRALLGTNPALFDGLNEDEVEKKTLSREPSLSLSLSHSHNHSSPVKPSSSKLKALLGATPTILREAADADEAGGASASASHSGPDSLSRESSADSMSSGDSRSALAGLTPNQSKLRALLGTDPDKEVAEQERAEAEAQAADISELLTSNLDDSARMRAASVHVWDSAEPEPVKTAVKPSKAKMAALIGADPECVELAPLSVGPSGQSGGSPPCSTTTTAATIKIKNLVDLKKLTGDGTASLRDRDAPAPLPHVWEDNDELAKSNVQPSKMKMLALLGADKVPPPQKSVEKEQVDIANLVGAASPSSDGAGSGHVWNSTEPEPAKAAVKTAVKPSKLKMAALMGVDLETVRRSPALGPSGKSGNGPSPPTTASVKRKKKAVDSKKRIGDGTGTSSLRTRDAPAPLPHVWEDNDELAKSNVQPSKAKMLALLGADKVPPPRKSPAQKQVDIATLLGNSVSRSTGAHVWDTDGPPKVSPASNSKSSSKPAPIVIPSLALDPTSAAQGTPPGHHMWDKPAESKVGAKPSKRKMLALLGDDPVASEPLDDPKKSSSSPQTASDLFKPVPMNVPSPRRAVTHSRASSYNRRSLSSSRPAISFAQPICASNMSMITSPRHGGAGGGRSGYAATVAGRPLGSRKALRLMGDSFVAPTPIGASNGPPSPRSQRQSDSKHRSQKSELPSTSNAPSLVSPHHAHSHSWAATHSTGKKQSSTKSGKKLVEIAEEEAIAADAFRDRSFSATVHSPERVPQLERPESTPAMPSSSSSSKHSKRNRQLRLRSFLGVDSPDIQMPKDAAAASPDEEPSRSHRRGRKKKNAVSPSASPPRRFGRLTSRSPSRSSKKSRTPSRSRSPSSSSSSRRAAAAAAVSPRSARARVVGLTRHQSTKPQRGKPKSAAAHHRSAISQGGDFPQSSALSSSYPAPTRPLPAPPEEAPLLADAHSAAGAPRGAASPAAHRALSPSMRGTGGVTEQLSKPGANGILRPHSTSSRSTRTAPSSQHGPRGADKSKLSSKLLARLGESPTAILDSSRPRSSSSTVASSSSSASSSSPPANSKLLSMLGESSRTVAKGRVSHLPSMEKPEKTAKSRAPISLPVRGAPSSRNAPPSSAGGGGNGGGRTAHHSKANNSDSLGSIGKTPLGELIAGHTHQKDALSSPWTEISSDTPAMRMFCSEFIIKCYQRALAQYVQADRSIVHLMDLDGHAASPMALEGYILGNIHSRGDWECIGVIHYEIV